MGQSAHPARSAGVGVALAVAGAVVAAVTLTGCGTSVANSATVLQRVYHASVVHSDGSTVGAVDGLRLRAGDVVRTAPDGRADLVTLSRVVYVGSDATVLVVDGARQQLRHGAVVVDAQRGPGLDLAVGGLAVSTGPGSAVRAERSLTTRVATLAGSAAVTSDSGRRLAVPALAQAVVGGDALPDATTPLRLTDDDGEAHAAPGLVRDDETLVSVAAGVDATGNSTARIVTAAWSRPLVPTPRGVQRSERVLPVVLASAAQAADRGSAYDRAVALRRAGGSWGVIAHLLGLPVPSVLDALAALERGQPAGQIGDVAAILAAARAVPADLTTTPAPGGPGDNGNGPGGNGNGNDGNGNGSGGGQPTGTPTTSPTTGTGSPDPVQSTVATVEDTVAAVLSLLPTPVPTVTSVPTVDTSLPGPILTSVLPPLPTP